ncbi:G4 quadruplex nucleic acid binding protein, partial [Kickxella alabastrina]
IDLRIGIIETVSRHPAADSLFVLSVDVGEKSDAEAAPRTIVSGLVGYYSEEQLQGKKIVVLANMKTRKLRGVLSQGMILAAANTKADATQVEVLEAGAAAQPGDIVGLLGGDDEAVVLVKAKAVVKRQHVIEAFLEGLSLDDRVAKYRGRELVVSGGAVTTRSLLSGVVG